MQRDRRVHVVGRRNDDRVDVLLLLEHLAVVAVLLQFRQVLRHEALEVVAAVLRGPARIRLLLGRRGLRTRRRAAPARTGGNRGVRLGLEFLDPGRHERVVHVAEGDEVLAHQRPRVAGAHAEADHRDIDGVARRLNPMAQDMPRHDRQRRPRARHCAHEFPSGDVAHCVPFLQMRRLADRSDRPVILHFSRAVVPRFMCCRATSGVLTCSSCYVRRARCARARCPACSALRGLRTAAQVRFRAVARAPM